MREFNHGEKYSGEKNIQAEKLIPAEKAATANAYYDFFVFCKIINGKFPKKS